MKCNTVERVSPTTSLVRYDVLCGLPEEDRSVRAKSLIPVVKLTEKETYAPWEYIPCPIVVVRMQDIVCPNGKNFNSIFEEIKEAGSINDFFNHNCRVILSTIMHDKTIYGCDVDRYVEAIQTIKPNYFMTLDGETYEGEVHLATHELERILEESIEIINKCKISTPLGLVKGASLQQIREHVDSLCGLGLNAMVFHSGDFLAGGGDALIGRAKKYAKAIREKTDYLFLYGIGSLRSFRQFFFADGFITQSHYVNGFYGQRFSPYNWKWYKRRGNKKYIMPNLSGLYLAFEDIEKQKMNGGLIPWVEERGVIDNLMPRPGQVELSHIPKIRLGL